MSSDGPVSETQLSSSATYYITFAAEWGPMVEISRVSLPLVGLAEREQKLDIGGVFRLTAVTHQNTLVPRYASCVLGVRGTR